MHRSPCPSWAEPGRGGPLAPRSLSVRARPGPDPDRPGPPPEPEPPAWRGWLLPGGLLLTTVLMLAVFTPGPTAKTYTYTELLAQVEADRVASVRLDDLGAVSGELEDGTRFTSQLPTALGPLALEEQLREQGVEITATRAEQTSWLAVALSLLPLALIIALFVWTGRAAQRSLAGGMGALGSMGRSKTKVTDVQRPQTRFSDIAGYEGVKQEVSEVVDALRSPERYRAAGAKTPRGVLMVGPPGTGKTLLARAVAGEADVPFLSVTGSSFVEMFVGVGASRVRDLFEEARKRSPSIIFIDEIDAIGGHRARGAVLSNDEREQTLNQLLAEMDGFDQDSDTIVLAATNRPEALDRALLRPGRFDRQVVVPLPHQDEREAILRVHARSRHLTDDVDLQRVARGTPGFSGADLANLVNEAAINAVRDGRTTVTTLDLDAARDRVLLGRRDTSNALMPAERRAVAVHESGHALVAALCKHADPVDKVTILPSGLALGVTEQLPEVERHLYSQSFLDDLLTVRLGGRAAELVVLGEASSGAANDLAEATGVAIRMVVELGLSPRLGPVGYGPEHGEQLDRATGPGLGRPYAEQTQRIVDKEVAEMLRQAEGRALLLLQDHRDALDRLVEMLLELETVDGTAVRAVLDGDRPPAASTSLRAAADAQS